MIHLDSNFIIHCLETGSDEARAAADWLSAGELFTASAISWMEFLSGPLKPGDLERGQFLLQGRIIPFAEPEAQMAASLFNLANRRRSARRDTMIAAAAICANARLATGDRGDFQIFEHAGLRLMTW